MREVSAEGENPVLLQPAAELLVQFHGFEFHDIAAFFH